MEQLDVEVQMSLPGRQNRSRHFPNPGTLILVLACLLVLAFAAALPRILENAPPSRSEPQPKTPGVAAPAEPVLHVPVLDGKLVVPLGIDEGGLFTELFPEGQELPVTRQELLTVVGQGRESVNLQVLLGFSQLSARAHVLAECHVTGFPGTGPKPPKIELRIGIDANGLLTISAAEPLTLSMDRSADLPLTEIEYLRNQADEHLQSDRPLVRQLQDASRAQTLLLQAKDLLPELDGQATPESCEAMCRAVDELEDALRREDTAEISRKTLALTEVLGRGVKERVKSGQSE